ncbi:MAG: protein kinase [Deltaproteobacteria bacterium]|nr:protein kinase [Deltaproteobacteria bacterium]
MSDDPLPYGATLGAFLLEGRVGQGGMGTVYRARNRITGEARAVKVVRPEHAANDELRARFVREMRLASAVDHPNVVRVYEPSMEGDTLILPMEFVEGITLRAHLRSGDGAPRRLGPDEALALAIPLCDGVAALHALGVVHRDLKPPNVMLVRSPDGALVPKVLDLGAALDLSGSDEATRDGLVVGTPAYMPFEQAAGRRDLDARADVYALGVILYEMLAGRRPYDGDDSQSVLAKVIQRLPFPALGTLAPELDRGLAALVDRALAHDRQVRPADARALADTAARSTARDPRGQRRAAGVGLRADHRRTGGPCPASVAGRADRGRCTRCACRRPRGSSRREGRAARHLWAHDASRARVTRTPAGGATRAGDRGDAGRAAPRRPARVGRPNTVVQHGRVGRSRRASSTREASMSAAPRGGLSARRGLLMRGALLLSLLAFPAASLAQSPACPGSEPMRGEALNPRIRALYESATGRRNLRPRELDEVIALATEQCRSGDDRGLVWRAAARYALACGGEGACERPDAGTREALRRAVGDLDDWLAAHPRASLNRPQLEFIAPLDVGLARYVAQVRVVSRPAGVVARLGDSLMHDGVPLRTIGPATVSVTSVQHEALTIELPAEAGTVTSLAIVESPDAPVVGDARRVALRRLVASMPGARRWRTSQRPRTVSRRRGPCDRGRSPPPCRRARSRRRASGSPSGGRTAARPTSCSAVGRRAPTGRASPRTIGSRRRRDSRSRPSWRRACS